MHKQCMSGAASSVSICILARRYFNYIIKYQRIKAEIAKDYTHILYKKECKMTKNYLSKCACSI